MPSAVQLHLGETKKVKVTLYKADGAKWAGQDIQCSVVSNSLLKMACLKVPDHVTTNSKGEAEIPVTGMGSTDPGKPASNKPITLKVTSGMATAATSVTVNRIGIKLTPSVTVSDIARSSIFMQTVIATAYDVDGKTKLGGIQLALLDSYNHEIISVNFHNGSTTDRNGQVKIDVSGKHPGTAAFAVSTPEPTTGATSNPCDVAVKHTSK